jgi:hypothetical protein
MVRFYEMMYYAIYRRQLEGKADNYNHSGRLYFFLVFLNATALLMFLNPFLQRQGIILENGPYYSILLGAVTGLGVNLIMGKRATKIKATFENSNSSEMATNLLVYLFVSLTLFIAAVWRLQNP